MRYEVTGKFEQASEKLTEVRKLVRAAEKALIDDDYRSAAAKERTRIYNVDFDEEQVYEAIDALIDNLYEYLYKANKNLERLIGF